MSVPYPPNDPNQPPAQPYGTVPPAPSPEVPAPPVPPAQPADQYGPPPVAPYQAGPYTPPPGAPYGQPAPQAANPFNMPNITASEAKAEAKSFIARMMDVSFSSYVTPSIAKFVYIVIIIAAALYWLGDIISSFGYNVFYGLQSIILGGVRALLMVIIARVALEVALAIIRTSINSNKD